MPARPPTSSKESLINQPEKAGKSLAQIILCQSNNDVVLGQAWLVGANRLITCGHVVDKYLNAPKDVFVYFPSTGNKYPILQIKLHPSFVRQPDGLVKFDAALLTVSLAYPESDVEPLPFYFEKQLTANQQLTVIRYPVHLGQISASMQPLAQKGRFLGYLRKHDNFHLLHDLALSAGDSGAPIFDDDVVVAIHCGDTATLPGLNLPTTSIRLALWVDALRELGIIQTKQQPMNANSYKSFASWLIFLVLSFFLSFGFMIASYWQTNNWQLNEPQVRPASVFFNEPVHNYKLNEDVKAEITAQSDCYLYLFHTDSKSKQVLALYPPYGYSALVRANDPKTVSQFGHTKLTADPNPGVWYLVAINPRHDEITKQLLKESDWSQTDSADRPLNISSDELLNRLQKLKQANKSLMWYASIDAPSSNAPIAKFKGPNDTSSFVTDTDDVFTSTTSGEPNTNTESDTSANSNQQ